MNRCWYDSLQPDWNLIKQPAACSHYLYDISPKMVIWYCTSYVLSWTFFQTVCGSLNGQNEENNLRNCASVTGNHKYNLLPCCCVIFQHPSFSRQFELLSWRAHSVCLISSLTAVYCNIIRRGWMVTHNKKSAVAIYPLTHSKPNPGNTEIDNMWNTLRVWPRWLGH